jgi:hypothetical protein
VKNYSIIPLDRGEFDWKSVELHIGKSFKKLIEPGVIRIPDGDVGTLKLNEEAKKNKQRKYVNNKHSELTFKFQQTEP